MKARITSLLSSRPTTKQPKGQSSRLTPLHSFVVFALFVFSQMVSAVTPADIEAAQRQADVIQKQEQERLRNEREELRRKTERVDGMDTDALIPEVSVPEIGAPCRDIDVITISNSPNMSESFREKIDEQFTGRCLNVSDIERILGEITKHYIDRGYVTTRAYLAPQDLTKGHLTILVIEGLIEQIDVQDGGASSVSPKLVFPAADSELLNLRDLEQGIDQINRLASNNARLDIQPGEKPGQSRVVVQNTVSSPYHFSATFDNQGSKSTGRNQLGLSAIGDNLLGFNDMFSFTHRQSIPPDFNRQNSISDNLNFSLPYGYSTLYIGASFSEYDSPISLPSGQELISSGKTKNVNIRLDRVMYRDQTTRASLASTLTVKETKSYLGGEFLAVSSRRLSVLDLDGTVNTDLAGGVLTASLGYALGLSQFGALNDIDNLPNDAPRAQFGKFKLSLNYARSFKMLDRFFSFSSALSAQKANDTLFGSEQISIGGIYSVRGFVDNTLSGDDGFFVRNELATRHTFSVLEELVSSRFYLGLDGGKVTSRGDGIPEGRMTGVALGVSGAWRKLSWDLFNSRPLTLPSSMNKESSETWLRLTYAL